MKRIYIVCPGSFDKWTIYCQCIINNNEDENSMDNVPFDGKKEETQFSSHVANNLESFWAATGHVCAFFL